MCISKNEPEDEKYEDSKGKGQEEGSKNYRSLDLIIILNIEGEDRVDREEDWIKWNTSDKRHYESQKHHFSMKVIDFTKQSIYQCEVAQFAIWALGGGHLPSTDNSFSMVVIRL